MRAPRHLLLLGIVVACGEPARPPPAAPPLLVVPPISAPPVVVASEPADAGAAPSARPAAPRGSVRLGTLETDQDRAAVRGVLEANEATFVTCYETALASDAGLEGRVVILFEIGKTGDVESAIDGGSRIADTAVVGCIKRAVLALDFPPPKRGSSFLVTAPFELRRVTP